jgi:ketosteroid isomerase-like protein
MMKKVGTLLIWILIMTSTVAAQTAQDAAELKKLLNDFLAGASRNDPAVHERFWADDLIYTRSAGRRVDKAEIMRGVRSAPAPKPEDPRTVYTAEDIRIHQYGKTAIVAFRLVATTEGGETKQVQNLLNSGTFVKRDGKWQVVNWQSTRMARTEEQDMNDVKASVEIFRQSLKDGDTKRLTTVTAPTFVWFQKRGIQIIRHLLINDLSSGHVKPFDIQLPNESLWLYGETAMYTGEAPTARYMLVLTNDAGTWKVVALHTSD